MGSDAHSGAQPAFLQVNELQKLFPVRAGLFRRPAGYLHAVDGVSFTLGKGECLGLVGESGCGKSTTARLLMQVCHPTAGQISLNGQDITRLKTRELRVFRRQAQMIMQDPFASLNPRLTVYDLIAEPLIVHQIGNIVERLHMVREWLGKVGLTPADTYLYRFPHELSGGQRQRVAIARTLVLHPAFVVADEPTSMLDLSVRAAIVHLIRNLREELQMTSVYITHDLAVARALCDRIAVMYLGKIVECGPSDEVIRKPMHPYTKALIAAAPVPGLKITGTQTYIKGQVSPPINPLPRCRFYERCPQANLQCAAQEHPPTVELAAGHQVSCYAV